MQTHSFVLILAGVSEITDVSTIRETETVEEVRVVRVESEAANTIANINADLLGVSPES